MSMVRDEESGHPGCDICGHPPSRLFAEGVFLCVTHEAEARCLAQEGAHIEWSLTAEGLAALTASSAAELAVTRHAHGA